MDGRNAATGTSAGHRPQSINLSKLPERASLSDFKDISAASPVVDGVDGGDVGAVVAEPSKRESTKKNIRSALELKRDEIVKHMLAKGSHSLRTDAKTHLRNAEYKKTTGQSFFVVELIDPQVNFLDVKTHSSLIIVAGHSSLEGRRSAQAWTTR